MNYFGYLGLQVSLLVEEPIVLLGSNVSLFCEWDYEVDMDKSVAWYVSKNSDGRRQLLYQYNGEDQDDVTPPSGINMELMQKDRTTRRIGLSLLNATRNYQANYSCSVTLAVSGLQYSSRPGFLEIYGK